VKELLHYFSSITDIKDVLKQTVQETFGSSRNEVTWYIITIDTSMDIINNKVLNNLSYIVVFSLFFSVHYQFHLCNHFSYNK
jgi:hypothetical protein